MCFPNKAPLNNPAFLKPSVALQETKTFTPILLMEERKVKRHDECCTKVPLKKIKISRPLSHILSNSHHSYLLASVHIGIPGKAYDSVTVYFKQQRKHASQLASMFQHCLSSNKYWCLPPPEPSSLRGFFLCKAPLLNKHVWVTSLALDFYCRIPKQTVF